MLDDAAQSRRVGGEPFQNLLVRLIGRTGFGQAKQFEGGVGGFLAKLAGLLLVDDPAIDLRHRIHALAHQADEVRGGVLARHAAFHGSL